MGNIQQQRTKPSVRADPCVKVFESVYVRMCVYGICSLLLRTIPFFGVYSYRAEQ